MKPELRPFQYETRTELRQLLKTLEAIEDRTRKARRVIMEELLCREKELEKEMSCYPKTW